MVYTYDKQLWKDYPDTSTPITADRLNHMEDGISEAAKNGGGGESDKVGVVKMFSGSTAPEGWLICDGSAVSRTTYSDLFALIGTTYGEGDGSTTFNIPNIKGKTVVGLNSDDTDFSTLGKTGGSKTYSHSHGKGETGSTVNPIITNVTPGAGSYVVGAGNSVETVNVKVVQPYIVLNYIIKASTTTPTQGGIIDSLDGNSTVDAPSVRAVNEGLGNIRGQILWENTNPQAITTETPITLNSSDYDMYEVLYTYNMSLTTNDLMSSGRIKKGNNSRLQFSYVSNGGISLRDRIIRYKSDTSLAISEPLGNDGTTTTIIPRYIIGYKTGLFD